MVPIVAPAPAPPPLPMMTGSLLLLLLPQLLLLLVVAVVRRSSYTYSSRLPIAFSADGGTVASALPADDDNDNEASVGPPHPATCKVQLASRMIP